MTSIGEKAPNFTAPIDGGGEISLADLTKGYTVLFFYPRDDTSGCTKEAIEFTTRAPELAALNAKAIGVSKDSVAKHDKFKAKHDLGVVLISDEHGQLCEDFGVWKEKSMYGKTYMGIERSTFILDETGTIINEWRKVKVTGHVDEVIEALKSVS